MCFEPLSLGRRESQRRLCSINPATLKLDMPSFSQISINRVNELEQTLKRAAVSKLSDKLALRVRLFFGYV